MAEQRCLNCEGPVPGKYCAACGQAIDVERFTLRALITKDLPNLLFKVNGGFLFTVRELFRRPGHVVRDYVGGKRVRYTNAAALVVVLASLDAFLRSFWGFQLADTVGEEDSRALARTLEVLRAEHSKLFFLGALPLRAALSLLVFRRARQRYAEHLIIDCYGTAAGLAISAVFSGLVTLIGADPVLANHITELSVLVVVGYYVVYYQQYFSTFGYSRLGLFVRSVLAPLLEYGALVALLLGYLLLFLR